MKRPLGVILSAVLLILGSLFQLLMALGMAFSGAVTQSQIHTGGIAAAPAAASLPGWMPVFMYVLCAFFVALAAWGILTAVGVIRMRRWARYSILVIGGVLALIGLVSFLATLLMTLIPLPVPANVDASQAHTTLTMVKVLFGVMAFVHAIVCAVGISWLVYFNRQQVRDAFAITTGNTVESRRPILISVLAGLNWFGAGSCLLCVFLPIPAAIFWWILYGWGKVALYLVFAALAASVGVGLWQLKQWGWRLALAMQALGLVNTVVYLVRPSLMLRYMVEINKRMVPMQSQLPERFQTMMNSASLGFAVLFIVAITAVLLYYRKVFECPIESSAGDPGVQE